MLTNLCITNFKRFGTVDIELGQTVVFIGPNNSGKSSALQALALWDVGLRTWAARRQFSTARVRTGVTLNRRDLLATPVPAANLLWRDLHVRSVTRSNGPQQTSNVLIDITVDGIIHDNAWRCGLEFDYVNPESLVCRPSRLADGKNPPRMPVPDPAHQVRVAYLPPMSGLAANETRLDPGAIDVRIGEGRTAEVLRNLVNHVFTESPGDGWPRLQQRIQALFGITLNAPEYVVERGEIVQTYVQQAAGRAITLDLSSAGRGLQQTLLILSYLLAHPGAVLLIDEPDAHLEFLRQRQIYQEITDMASAQGCQVIAASHSEVLLNEAADRDIVVAFVGRPHRIDDRGSQVLKSLKEIGFEHYIQAEQKGWVLYLEGSTDLAILRQLAATLNHPASAHLARPFVHYVGNQPPAALRHFHGLREAKPDLVGLALYDRLESVPDDAPHLRHLAWRRRKIESYFAFPDVLERYARTSAEREAGGPLFAVAEVARRVEIMRACVADRVPPAALRNADDAWWRDEKASDAFLGPIFQAFFDRLGLPNLMRKTDYHVLAGLATANELDPEITDKLDAIVAVAQQARPVTGGDESSASSA